MSCSLCLLAALLRRHITSISKSMGMIVDLSHIKTQGSTRVIYGEGKEWGKRSGDRKNGQGIEEG